MDALPASVSASTSAAGSDVAPTPEDSPPRRTAPRHRRAQSEILLGATALPDDLAFDAADLGVVVGETALPGDDEDEDEYEDYEEGSGGGAGGGSRMFQMFLEAGGRLSAEQPDHPAPYPPPLPARPRHQHSMSMDGSTSFASAASPGLGGRAAADAKKAISDAKLAELALVDPKRAKRYVLAC
jgi:hypothetical protein